ncbi:hypothetical protein ABL78_3359 [Leptomonas seymouri]|uniref:Uncharacterized protein n=1 Tax=Leptomonas seymouri TaxID=5684 RepID=A0A0N1PCN1_LEPSE|nr:hypothetical protein ABL78_3359 [Leptomonas seymouri]|eukprot:KPI87562.1 hypothetical protein ABL78_3359 [Leptomonas seymouri]
MPELRGAAALSQRVEQTRTARCTCGLCGAVLGLCQLELDEEPTDELFNGPPFSFPSPCATGAGADRRSSNCSLYFSSAHRLLLLRHSAPRLPIIEGSPKATPSSALQRPPGGPRRWPWR